VHVLARMAARKAIQEQLRAQGVRISLVKPRTYRQGLKSTSPSILSCIGMRLSVRSAWACLRSVGASRPDWFSRSDC
jgi:hypothetical protein